MLEMLSLIVIYPVAIAFLVVCFCGFHGALRERPSYQSPCVEAGAAPELLFAMRYQSGEHTKKPAGESEAA